MAWTILGKGIEAEGTNKWFSINLDLEEKHWNAVGPDVVIFFKHRSGDFTFAVIPERGLQLVTKEKGKTVEVAFFHDLVASSNVNDHATGRADDHGLNFEWTLQSK